VGLPRLVYDPGTGSINVDLPEELDQIEDPGGGRNRGGRRNDTQRGVVTYQFEKFYWLLHPMIMRMNRNQTVEDALEAFWAHAGKGKKFDVLLDRTKNIDTTLDGAAAAGQKVVPVADTSGMIPGSRIWLINVLQQHMEPVTIDTVSPAISFNTVNNLVFAYVSGDVARSEDYYRLCTTTQDQNPKKIDRGSATFSFDLQCETAAEIITA